MERRLDQEGLTLGEVIRDAGAGDPSAPELRRGEWHGQVVVVMIDAVASGVPAPLPAAVLLAEGHFDGKPVRVFRSPGAEPDTLARYSDAAYVERTVSRIGRMAVEMGLQALQDSVRAGPSLRPENVVTAAAKRRLTSVVVDVPSVPIAAGERPVEEMIAAVLESLREIAAGPEKRPRSLLWVAVAGAVVLAAGEISVNVRCDNSTGDRVTRRDTVVVEPAREPEDSTRRPVEVLDATPPVKVPDATPPVKIPDAAPPVKIPDATPPRPLPPWQGRRGPARCEPTGDGSVECVLNRIGPSPARWVGLRCDLSSGDGAAAGPEKPWCRIRRIDGEDAWCYRENKVAKQTAGAVRWGRCKR